VFDLNAVTFISSAGIRVILKTQKALKQRNGKVVLISLQPQVKKVFEIIDALPSLSVFASIEELDQYLDHIQRKITEKT
jgi:anti-sigma B factor antagonist